MRDHWADEVEALALARGGKVGKIAKRVLHSEPNLILGRVLNPPSVQVLVIDNWLPCTLNKTMRGKISARIQISRDSHDMIAVESLRQGLVRATGARRVQLTVVFSSSHTRPDPDNLAKTVLDGLKNCGLLLDDRYEDCEWFPPIYMIGKQQTRIELTDIPTKVVGRLEA